MRPVDAELRRNVGAHAHGTLAHVDVEALDVERRKQELRAHIVVVEIVRIFAPHIEDALRVRVLVAVPIFRVAVDRVGRERPPERRVAAGRGVGRLDVAVASAVAHQHIGEFLGFAVFETLLDLFDIVHSEKDVERAVDVRVEGA